MTIMDAVATCNKCGREIENGEPVWFINQYGVYGSVYDNERLTKEFCDKCLERFLEE